MPAVEIQEVSVRFGGAVVLSRVSAMLEGPALIAIVGPSGAGKTTLLHAVSGLVPVQAGAIHVRGSSSPAWVVQNSPLFTRRSAQENVALGAIAMGMEWHAAQADALSVMREVGIDHLARRSAFKLSGGERQRVAVARAIASRSQLVLADEPTASLDAVSREFVCGALLKAAHRGALVLATTHDPHVAGIAHRVFSLDAGRLEEDVRVLG